MKQKIIFTTLLIEKSPQAIPLGAACVASAVKNNLLTADLCEPELLIFNMEDFCINDECFCFTKSKPKFKDEDFIADFIAKKILEKKPAITGFSVFVWNSVILQKVSVILRKNNVFTFAGGPEITSHPNFFSVFDKIVCGEGENKVPAVVYEFLCGRKVENFAEYGLKFDANPKNGGNKVLKESCFDSTDLMQSPYLDGTLNPSDYGGVLWELARGCPFKCSYCYESKGEKSVRKFPIERIKKELDLFAKKRIPQVFVLDPTYNADKNRALQLLKLIKQKTPETFYYFEARAEFIDSELAKAFSEIHCSLQIGLQTADENVAKLVNRPFNLKKFTKKISLLNKFGVIFGLDVIYGLPGDTFAGFKNTVNYAISLYPNNLEIFCLSVLPGTLLFDEAEKLKLVFEQNPPYNILHTDKFSKKDLIKAGKIAHGCNVFYNEGRAVPWFNTICRTLKEKPSVFFEKFCDFLDLSENLNELNLKNHYNHKDIEILQKKFVKEQLCQKNLAKFYAVAQDLISFHGAISRKTDTNESEIVELHYPAEYLDSEYAFDLDFFVKNVKIKPVRFRT